MIVNVNLLLLLLILAASQLSAQRDLFPLAHYGQVVITDEGPALVWSAEAAAYDTTLNSQSTVNGWVGFRPAYYSGDLPRLDLDARSLSVFFVYRDVPGQTAQELWRVLDGESVLLRQTTTGVRNHLLGKQHTLDGMTPGWPRISTFSAGISSRNTNAVTFELSKDFSGLLLAAIVVPRVLTTPESESLRSMLSLQYGVPIGGRPSWTYRDGSLQPVHRINRSEAYRYRITGIGQDPVWGWRATSNSSAYDQGLFRVTSHSVTDDATSPDRMLLWGDNGKALRLKPWRGVHEISRTWALWNKHWSAGDKVDLSWSTNMLPDAPAGTHPWLVYNRGEGSEETTTIFPLQLSEDGRLTLNSFQSGPPTDQPGFLQLIYAPAFFALATTAGEDCRPDSLTLTPVGGRPPYKLIVNQDDASHEVMFSGSAATLTLTTLIADSDIRYTVEDADGLQFTGNIGCPIVEEEESKLLRVAVYHSPGRPAIEVSLSEPAVMRYSLYSAGGRKVDTGMFPPGIIHHYRVPDRLPAGVYYCRIIAGDSSINETILIN